MDDWLEGQDNQPTALPDKLPESEHVALVVAVTAGNGEIRAFLLEDEDQLELSLNPYSFQEGRRLFYTVRRSALELAIKKD